MVKDNSKCNLYNYNYIELTQEQIQSQIVQLVPDPMFLKRNILRNKLIY